MPRVTRAALRSHALLDEADLASSTPLPLTPVTRVPLGEVAGNREEIRSELRQLSKVEKKPPVKGKKGRVAKKAKSQENDKINNETVEVLEDDSQSATSSAVDEACQKLMQESSGGKCRVQTPERRRANIDFDHKKPTKLSCMMKDHTHRHHARSIQ